MGFFSKLKKVFNPGGAIISKVVNDGRDYQGLLDVAMNSGDQAKKNQEAQAAALRSGNSSGQKPYFTPDPGLNPQANRLGWTSGGYNYAKSPVGNPSAAPPGGGGGAGMGMSGPQQMQMGGPMRSQTPAFSMGQVPNMASGAVGQALQGMGGGGSMPPAGAPPQGQPTMQIPQNPQMVQAMMLRGRMPRPM